MIRGILGTIASAIADPLWRGVCALFLRVFRGRCGFLHGEWNAWIFSGDKVVKTDHVICHHRGSRVAARIRRIAPHDQTYKRWKFTGRLNGNLLFGHFWSTVQRRIPRSCGTIQLYYSEDRDLLRGYYVRLSSVTDESETGHFHGGLQDIRYEWHRRS